MSRTATDVEYVEGAPEPSVPVIRYTERLTAADALASVGSRGDSYGNAAAGTIGLLKTDLITRRGPWRGLDGVEVATLEWVSWFNDRRLHSFCRDVPPAEFEDHCYRGGTLAGNRAGNPRRGEPSLY